MTNVNYIAKRPLMIGAGYTENFVSQTELAVNERTAYNGRAYILTYSKEVPMGVAKDLELLELIDDSDIERFTDDMVDNIAHNFELEAIAPYANSDNASDRKKAYDYMVKKYIPQFLNAWQRFLTPTQFNSVKEGLKVKLNVA